MTQEELLVEAKTSLIGAAEKFDVSKNARLTSYAWFDIMRCLQRLCQNEGALLPMARSALHDLYRLDKAEKELSQQNATDPTLSEVAAKVCTPALCNVNISYNICRLWIIFSWCQGSWTSLAQCCLTVQELLPFSIDQSQALRNA